MTMLLHIASSNDIHRLSRVHDASYAPLSGQTQPVAT
ncbi:hypothetical protein PABG_11472 [Paracoccidioides brasiliensis Pb03]|nr:hypothetical protein PABG_11472 [Paracoccidioides brasiliensis Pb03]